MMPLAAATLMSSFSTIAQNVAIFSPTRSASVRKYSRVEPFRFRYEPYGPRVIANIGAIALPSAETTSCAEASAPLSAAIPPLSTYSYVAADGYECATRGAYASMSTSDPFGYTTGCETELTFSGMSSADGFGTSSSSSIFGAGHATATTTVVMDLVAAADEHQELAAVAPANVGSSRAGSSHTGAPRYAIVDFKHESVTYLAPFKIAAGDLVVVEGDRGENIGIVREIFKATPAYDVPSRVVRKATESDKGALSEQRAKELLAIEASKALAESLGLHGKVEDAEYQFDMNKLTIFVRRPSKSTFVDFRKLQRGLFREFRCRIWCAYMDEVEASESAAPRTK